MIYLDYASATPIDDAVLDVMQPYWQDKFYNPSGLYRVSREVKRELQQAREVAAKAIGAQAHEVYFTAGATEANNLAIAGITRQYPEGKAVISQIEHDAVRRVANSSADTHDVEIDAGGRIDMEALSRAIDDETVLVSIEHVNSEIGTIQPLRRIAALIADVRSSRHERGVELPIYLHTDASQALDALSFNVEALGVDLATINGAKIYGPKQSGLLYVRKGIELAPLLQGGSQERGIRAGTENVAFAAGVAKALELAVEKRGERQKHYASLQSKLLDDIDNTSGVELNGGRKHRLASNINLSAKGLDGEMLLHYMDAQGVQVATGAACTANYDSPSHVLTALGLDEESIQGSLRLSFGRNTTEPDVKKASEILFNLIEKLRPSQ